MAQDHGPSVKDDKQYEALRKQGMSKSRAAAIANTPDASKKGGKSRAAAAAPELRAGKRGQSRSEGQGEARAASAPADQRLT